MSRSGYIDDYDDQWAAILWRGAVASAIRGRRGQAFLRELIEALDAMPEKKLVAHDLQCPAGVCAIGSVGLQRGVDMTELDPEDPGPIAGAFGIADALVREIEFVNDEEHWNATPEQRWQHVRDWAASKVGDPLLNKRRARA